MSLQKYRFWAIISLIPGVVSIFFCWYLTWIGIILNIAGMVIFAFLRSPYQEDPFNFQPAYQLARMAMVFNVIGMFLCIVFTLFQIRG